MQQFDRGRAVARPAVRQAFERAGGRYRRVPRGARLAGAAVALAGTTLLAHTAGWPLPETLLVAVAALMVLAIAMRNPRVAASALVLLAWIWALSLLRPAYPPGMVTELALALLGVLVAVAAHHLVPRLPPWGTTALALLAATVLGGLVVRLFPAAGVTASYVGALGVLAYRWVAARRLGATASSPAPARDTADGTAPPAPAARAREDEEPPPPLTVREAMDELDAMVGLEPVKRQVRAMAASIEASRLRAAAGYGSDTPLRHFVFVGPPGTGKTTVARIMARICYAFGLLPRPAVVEAQRADLVGEYVGTTAIKTNELVDRALGGVLFIDEAYSLAGARDGHGDRFGAEAVQTLLKRAEDDRDRLVIILAGYEPQMADFLDSNPGLGSRFGTRIRFPTYQPAELLSIAEGLVAARGDQLAADAVPPLRDGFEDASRRGIVDDLGNGRFVRSLVEAAAAARDVRVVGGGFPQATPPAADDLPRELVTLRRGDVQDAFAEVTSRLRGYAQPPSLAEALGELDRLIGLEPVKKQVRALTAQLRVAGMRHDQGLPTQPPMRHFVFVGPPGTGKTTVARVVGRIFAALGLIARPDVLEAQRADLVGEHLGATAIKTNRLIDRAVGGVLFIDEAYSLLGEGYTGGDAFGMEAVQTLLKRAEDDRDRLVVVLAGYQRPMDAFLAKNPGLASRFATRVAFPSHGPDELRRIAGLLAADAGDGFDVGASDVLGRVFAEVCDRGWIDELGNARFARSLYERACAARDVRVAGREEAAAPPVTQLTTVTGDDVQEAYEELTARFRRR